VLTKDLTDDGCQGGVFNRINESFGVTVSREMMRDMRVQSRGITVFLLLLCSQTAAAVGVWKMCELPCYVYPMAA
jgi:hypothetical protein